MEGPKRNRGCNFSAFEKSLLIELVSKYKSIVENNKSKGTTLKQKEEAWTKVCLEFNSHAEANKRNVRQLKQLYKNLKRNAKKDSADDRIERYKTGRDTITQKLTQESAKILAMLSEQGEPDTNPYNCDEECLDEVENIIVEETEMNWEQPFSEEPEAVQYEYVPPQVQSQEVPTPSTSGRKRKATMAAECRNRISDLAESKMSLCEREINLITKKYQSEMELIEFKKQNELLKKKVFQEKLMYYREKRLMLKTE